MIFDDEDTTNGHDSQKIQQHFTLNKYDSKNQLKIQNQGNAGG
jgi:hypothetical protein